MGNIPHYTTWQYPVHTTIHWLSSVSLTSATNLRAAIALASQLLLQIFHPRDTDSKQQGPGPRRAQGLPRPILEPHRASDTAGTTGPCPIAYGSADWPWRASEQYLLPLGPLEPLGGLGAREKQARQQSQHSRHFRNTATTQTPRILPFAPVTVVSANINWCAGASSNLLLFPCFLQTRSLMLLVPCLLRVVY